MKNLEVLKITSEHVPLRIASSTISAGFPSPAAAYEEDDLDIHDLVATNPNATFFVRVKGSSMIDANIYEGDILVVDRSVDPAHGKIVIAVVNGEFTVKTLYNLNSVVKLMPANPEYSEITFENDQELNIWGVVVYTIHKN